MDRIEKRRAKRARGAPRDESQRREHEPEWQPAALEPGTAFAYKGEPTAQEVRSMQWNLDKGQRDVASVVMRASVETVRDMTEQERSEYIERIRTLTADTMPDAEDGSDPQG